MDCRALIFDVFGTLVDWRTSVARQARALLAPVGVDVDWHAFADAWRARYQPAMEEVRSGREPYVPLDTLHRRNLDGALEAFGLARVDPATRDALNLAWHRLDAWPDAREGLARLRERFRIAPCSNGNIALMVDLARHNGFDWDAILGADIARDYKPKAVVYHAAAAAFGLRPGEVMMVAAHSTDLAAATRAGLRTAFVARPDEHGPGKGETSATVPVDWSARDLIDLARQLGT
jgi:2-haloacid dehalogenase